MKHIKHSKKSRIPGLQKLSFEYERKAINKIKKSIKKKL